MRRRRFGNMHGIGVIIRVYHSLTECSQLNETHSYQLPKITFVPLGALASIAAKTWGSLPL
jgi:hypothetical protein